MLIAHIFQKEKKGGDNIARAQTWKVKADPVAGNHQTQKKRCRNVHLKKNKTTIKNLNEHQVSISFPWMSAFQMRLSLDEKRIESKEVVSQQNNSWSQSAVLAPGMNAEV